MLGETPLARAALPLFCILSSHEQRKGSTKSAANLVAVWFALVQHLQNFSVGL